MKIRHHILRHLAALQLFCVIGVGMAQPGAASQHIRQDNPQPVSYQPSWPSRASASGRYRSETPALSTGLMWHLLYGGTTLFRYLGLSDASAMMDHYLGNSGEVFNVGVEPILCDLPVWSATVRQQANRLQRRAAEEIGNRSSTDLQSGTSAPYTLTLQTGWLGYGVTRDESADWYFALGRFTYNVMLVAAVYVSPIGGPAVMRQDVYLFVQDVYDWDSGRSTAIAGLRIGNDPIAQLHRAGLAQDYQVRGMTRLIGVALPMADATRLRQTCDNRSTTTY